MFYINIITLQLKLISRIILGFIGLCVIGTVMAGLILLFQYYLLSDNIIVNLAYFLVIFYCITLVNILYQYFLFKRLNKTLQIDRISEEEKKFYI